MLTMRSVVSSVAVAATVFTGAIQLAAAANADPVTGNCGFPPGDIYAHEFQCNRYGEFYTPPDPLPAGASGNLIRHEPMRLVYEPSGQLGSWVATGTRIMYQSTDATGHPDVVTGTYFEPYNAWPGKGPRPLIVYGPGTQGQGDQCAPSRQFNQGIHWSPYADLMVNYEGAFVNTMVDRGFAVLMTDYEGLGTIGVTHTYVSRLSEGHAMLDAARVARKLPGTSLTPDGPVAFWGYSQGGGAAGAEVGEAGAQGEGALVLVGGLGVEPELLVGAGDVGVEVGELAAGEGVDAVALAVRVEAMQRLGDAAQAGHHFSAVGIDHPVDLGLGQIARIKTRLLLPVGSDAGSAGRKQKNQQNKQSFAFTLIQVVEKLLSQAKKSLVISPLQICLGKSCINLDPMK